MSGFNSDKFGLGYSLGTIDGRDQEKGVGW